MNDIVNIIKKKTNLDTKSINNIIAMLKDGCTIAFIARYRKDMTNNASDEALLKFQDIYEYTQKLFKRKEEILNILREKELLTPKLQVLLNEAITLTSLEDIYEPYKGTKSTRADDALKHGLEPLANIILTMRHSSDEIKQRAKTFLSQHVKSVDAAIKGAKDIIALDYSLEIRTKEALRKNLLNHGLLVTKKNKNI